MFDLQRMFHVGIAVADLSEAMQRMGGRVEIANASGGGLMVRLRLRG